MDTILDVAIRMTVDKPEPTVYSAHEYRRVINALLRYAHAKTLPEQLQALKALAEPW